MNELSSQLEAIGLPAPSQVAQLEHETADKIAVAIRPLIRADHPDIGELLDAHQALVLWSQRLEVELARLGHKHAVPSPGPLITVPNDYTLGGVRGTHDEPCQHHLVWTDEKQAEITCRTCGTKVNPAWWVARHADLVALAERRFTETREEQRRIAKENEELRAERNKLRADVRRAKESWSKAAAKTASKATKVAAGKESRKKS